ncbi:MAG: hypothetical protein ACYSTR_03200 [Planctomycetota bacterium]
MPKEGDEVLFQNIKFSVESINQNRIRSVILTLESSAKAAENGCDT